MKVVDISIDLIKEYENNPRNNDRAVNKVAESISKFGFKVPVIIDKDNVIVTGHTRIKAAKKLGLEKVPCIVANDLTSEQIKAFRLADNKVAEYSTWDEEKLYNELVELQTMDFDIESFGFDTSEILEGGDTFSNGDEAEIKEDDFDVEPPIEPKSKLGDVYLLGNHKLMCGDSTKIEDVEKLMNGNKADMVFTDPPYGYNYQSNKRTKTDKFDVLINDDKILDFMTPLKMVNNGFVFVCTTWKVLDKWLPLFNKYYDLSNMIIWNKGGGGIGDLKHTFSTDYEIILCSNNNREITGKRIGSVWSITKDNANDYVHATQKPVGLSANAIKNVTKENQNVLDVFGGSGSTLIACEQLNRKCFMMELDPKYCDVIIKRWETLTGKQAVLLNG